MKKLPPPRRILLVRNDKLGDFMLAWPAIAALKQAFPEARLVALVPPYTQPMAELCPWIDEILVDSGEPGLRGTLALTRQFRSQRFDLMVTLFSTNRVGLAGMLAGIPVRWAPATKLAQCFYNHTLKQKRSRSEKPEYQYNLELVQAAFEGYRDTNPATPAPPYLQPQRDLASLRQAFIQTLNIPAGKKLVFIHAGHGGSANNLSLDQYAALARALADTSICFVLTAGPGELEATRTLARQLEAQQVDCRVYHSDQGLADFAQHLALADLFIAGSTGTLHIAGALDRPTVGFYPNRRSATPLRWRTLNSEGRYLAVTPPETVEQDMSRVDLDKAATEIRAFMRRIWD